MSPATRLLGILSILFLLLLKAAAQEQPSQLREGDLAGAAARLERALAGERDEKKAAELHKRLALLEYLLQRFDRFDEHIGEAIRLDPLDADARYQLGRRCFEEKRYREAMSAFQEALALQPSHYKARYYAGLVHEGENELESAKREFQAAIGIVEGRKIRYAWPFTELGELLVNEGDYERGLGWLYRATRNDPRSPHAWYHYARGLFQKQADFEVKEGLMLAISLDPGYSEAYYLLARYYQKTGEERLAKEAFARFEELKKKPLPSPFGLRRH